MKSKVRHWGQRWSNFFLCGAPNNFDPERSSYDRSFVGVTCKRCLDIIAKEQQRMHTDLEAEIAALQKELQDDITDSLYYIVDRVLEGRQGFARGCRQAA